MTSQSKPPAEPAGIELLLELLNASEGLVDRNAPPPDVVDDPLEATLPAEPESALPVAAQNDSLQGENEKAGHDERTHEISEPSGLADGLHPDIVEAEVSEDTADAAENRFAAHVVRGMSKSKIR
jgi:hypothetical protein